MDELDRDALFPGVDIEQSFLYEHEDLLLGLSFALAKSAKANRDLRDADLIGALTALGKTYQTLAQSGLHYETAATNPGQQVAIAEMKKTLEEFRAVEQQHRGRSLLRDSDILKGLVFLTRMAHGRANGRPKSRAYAEFLLQQFPDQPAAAQTGSRIIVP